MISDPLFVIFSAALLGLIIGSFLNVVIVRLPQMMQAQWRCDCSALLELPEPSAPSLSLATPASACPTCHTPIKARHNLPLLSYLWLRGRCAACRAPISVRYPLVECLSAALSAYAAWHFGLSWALAGALLLIYFLVALTFIDADTQLLPDDLTLPLLWLGLAFNFFHTYAALPDAVLGAMVGYASLWLVYWLFKWTTGKEGMGYGDFKLLAALGAWMGWQMLLLIVLIASIVGAVGGLGFILFAGRDRGTPLPFGPYLALGGLIALFFGTHINRVYLGVW